MLSTIPTSIAPATSDPNIRARILFMRPSLEPNLKTEKSGVSFAQGSADCLVLLYEPTTCGWFGMPSNSMRKTPFVYRRILAIAGFVVAIAATACGTPAAGAVPTPPLTGPVTADSVLTTFDNSTMSSGHFKLHGTFIKNRVYYPATGDGVLELRPMEALQMNLSVQTFGSQGVLKIQEVAIGTRLYSRVGNGKWGQKRESASATTPTTYVGEEIVSGVGYWHTRSTAGSTSFDMLINETNGYPVQLVYVSTSGTLTMNFNSYNQSPLITIPKG